MDISSLTVRELVKKIKNGKLTSVEICKTYIQKINKFEKNIKAWVYFDKKNLLAKAAQSDYLTSLGKPLGPLHGIPVAIKDIVGTADMPTKCGTKIKIGKLFSKNAKIIDLLVSAGAIIMGKTATAELAYLSPPATRNPHDYARTPGGSSSGSAAAVASYMAPLSIGSQTGGSIIRPASYCGVVGYKPTYGLISRNGVLKTSNKLDHIGVFGKFVDDVALLAKVLIKKDLKDPATIDYSTKNILIETKKIFLNKPKFIFYKTDFWRLIDNKSKESFEYFIKSFKKNIEVFDVPPYFKDIHMYHRIIHETDLANNFKIYYKKCRTKLSKHMQIAIKNGITHSAKDYSKAIDFIRKSYESHKRFFKNYDSVMSPSSAGVAPLGLKSTGTPDFNRVWSYLGTPCISLPLLKGEKNLPLGVQLITDRYEDHKLLKVTKWLEKECS